MPTITVFSSKLHFLLHKLSFAPSLWSNIVVNQIVIFAHLVLVACEGTFRSHGGLPYITLEECFTPPGLRFLNVVAVSPLETSVDFYLQEFVQFYRDSSFCKPHSLSCQFHTCLLTA